MGFAPLFPKKWIQLSFRVVKGGGLKIRCASFVGSNPTSTIPAWGKAVSKSFPCGFNSHSLYRKAIAPLI